MGRRLYASSSVFREAIDRCDARLEGELDRRLHEILFGEQADVLLKNAIYVQPGLFAFEYALAELWRSWAVRQGSSVTVLASTGGVRRGGDGSRRCPAARRSTRPPDVRTATHRLHGCSLCKRSRVRKGLAVAGASWTWPPSTAPAMSSSAAPSAMSNTHVSTSPAAVSNTGR